MNSRWRIYVPVKQTNKQKYTYEKTYHRLFRRCRHCVIAIRLRNSTTCDHHNQHDHHDARRARQFDDHHADPITIKVRALVMRCLRNLSVALRGRTLNVLNVVAGFVSEGRTARVPNISDKPGPRITRSFDIFTTADADAFSPFPAATPQT
jgi:hypothetical protein